MKVLHVNTYQTGGAARSCLRLHDALLNNGIDSKLLVLYKTSAHAQVADFRESLSFFKNLATKISNRSNINKHNNEIKKNGVPDELISFPDTAWDITKHPLYHWADVIQFHWIAGFVDLKKFFAKNTKPVIFTLHDYFLLTGSYHYPFQGMNAFDKIIEENKKAIEEKYTGQKISVVSPSLYLKEKAIETGYFHSNSIHHIPYGLSSETFSRKSSHNEVLNELRQSGKKILLFVADDLTYKRKGFDLLESALPLLPSEVSVLVVGNSGDYIPASEQIVFYGSVNNDEELAEIYNGADLFICPSRDDNFPNTVMEALFCGTPVIAFNKGGTPEMIHPENGIVAQNMDAAELAAAIKSGLEKNWNRNEISVKAIETYLPLKAAEAYKKIYQDLIQFNTR